MKSLQLDKPHALVVVGVQGSGKTFFAQKFADTFNAPFIEQAMFKKNATDDTSAELLMASMVSEISKTGRSIVIELDLTSRVERSELSRRLKADGYVTMFIWVQIDIETAISRSYRASRIDEAAYRERMRAFAPPHPSEKALVISGKHTFATQAKAVLKKLASPRSVQIPGEPRVSPTRGQIIVR